MVRRMNRCRQRQKRKFQRRLLAPQVPWEEADGELDDTLRKVVDQKIQGMMK